MNDTYYYNLAIKIREGDWKGQPPKGYKQIDAEIDLLDTAVTLGHRRKRDLDQALTNLGKKLYEEGHRL